ncbi:MAG: FIST C-terminal domain-containing protein [Deltaproteobacteria bacterium]|nr:FIST C-terminal domain-containing protein [Deltaproteobacteria bacterium]
MWAPVKILTQHIADIRKISSLRDLISEKMEADSVVGKPKVVFAFTGPKVDPYNFFEEVRNAVGFSVPIVGGSTKGLMCNTFVSNSDYSASLMFLETNLIEVFVSCERNIHREEEKAGKRLGKRFQYNDLSLEGLFIFFYQLLREYPGVKDYYLPHSGSYLLQGINAAVSSKLTIWGAGLSKDHNFRPGFQFCGFHVSQDHAMGIILGGPLKFYQKIIPGFTPLDGIERKVTRIRGPVIYELDGKPIIETINQILGEEEWQNESPVQLLTIGVNQNGKDRQDENLYICRSLVGLTPDEKGIILSDTDIKEGDFIQFLVRDPETTLESIMFQIPSLLRDIKSIGERPVLALYITSFPHSREYWDIFFEEAREVQKAINNEVPLIGFCCPVQIAEVSGRPLVSSGLGLFSLITEKNGSL